MAPTLGAPLQPSCALPEGGLRGFNPEPCRWFLQTFWTLFECRGVRNRTVRR
jgi:hypothetical protein